MTRQRGRHLGAAQSQGVEEPTHGFTDGGGFGGRAILETALRDRSLAGGHERPAGPPATKDNGLDSARPDIEPHDGRTEGSAEIHSGLL
jgi:hypothetical protein